MIYKLLNNRTYLGELRHKEQWVPAAHPAIIERELWDRVHTILATNCRVRATQAVVPLPAQGDRVRQRRARPVALALDEEE
jgi:site-specific DNA recombinase